MSKAAEFSIAFAVSQPGGAARVLDRIPANDAAAFLADVPTPAAAGVLEHMQIARAAAVIQESTPKTAAALLSAMSSNTRIVVLRAIPEQTRDAALNVLSRGERAAMRRYLTYAPGTVGAWMDTPRVTFPPDTTVENCLDRVRQLGERPGFLVFVVDAERRLRGCVELDALLSAASGTMLKTILRRDIVPLSPQASLAAVVSLSAWDISLSLPVIDRRRRLVGVLTFDSVREGLVVDRHSTDRLQVNLLLVHMASAFLAAMSGLARVATSEPGALKTAGDRGDTL